MPPSTVKASFDDLLEAIKLEHDSMIDECYRLHDELARASETLARRGEHARNPKPEDTDIDYIPSTRRLVTQPSLDSDPSTIQMTPNTLQHVCIPFDNARQSPRSCSDPSARTGQDLGGDRVCKQSSTKSEGMAAADSIYDLKRYEEEMRKMQKTTKKNNLFTELAEISKGTISQMASVRTKLMRQKSHREELEKIAAGGLGAFVRAELFSLMSAFLTISNAFYIGIETNAQVQDEMEWYFERATREEPAAGAWKIGSLIFVILFSLELIIRISADGNFFWVGGDKFWNLFDTLVVVTATVELILEYADVRVGFGVSVLRTLKIVRIFRLMRLQKHDHHSVLSRFIRNLKTMPYSLAGSATSFLSAMLLLVCIMYIFGLMFMQGLPQYLHRDRTREDIASKLNKYYGSLDKTLWSLIGSVTGGYDWTLVADPLKEIGTAYVLFFIMYIAFVLLGLLNILNGIFVHASVQAAETNRELAIDRMIGQRQTMMKDMINMFIEADVDKSGTISWIEFENYMEDDRVRAYFEALGLDTSSIWKIFNILDVSREGELGLAEFVEGCFRLRGPAKVVDLVRMQETATEMLNRISFLGANVRKFDNRMKLEMDDLFKKHDFLNTSLRVSVSHASASTVTRQTVSRPGTPKVMKIERKISESSGESKSKELMRRMDAAEMSQVTLSEFLRLDSAEFRRVDSAQMPPMDSCDAHSMDPDFIREAVESSRDAPRFASPAEEYKSIADPIIAAKLIAPQPWATQDYGDDRWKPHGIFPPRGPSAASLDSILSNVCSGETEPKQPPWVAAVDGRT